MIDFNSMYFWLVVLYIIMGVGMVGIVRTLYNEFAEPLGLLIELVIFFFWFGVPVVFMIVAVLTFFEGSKKHD